ncbi:hypothetical protein JDV02_005671 [Purpureocillium takamizusanense]|uniref:Amidase domain-containing protein n=1 Tax=Purpureocillium takamizusanense TaxID=2060973 RepID=A0A9Q8VC33_9HYPO|nr:uncharacterized protein JDV02_005671 [Purpureocillium takamizusanense]UNI19489.1 hypothetical protein JDV02_005671 [Purpureocillium takamizusanense]
MPVQGSIQETINPDAIVPVTLLETHEIFGDVDATLRLFDSYDDVFVPEFGAVLVEKPGPNATSAAADVEPSSHGRRLYRLSGDVEVTGDVAGLPSGPYFLYGPNLYQAWRLYDDDLGAFAVGVIPENVTHMSGFRALTALSDSGASKSIAVPSRLYHHAPNAKKPLSGIRVAIPDVSSLLGVQTTVSSRAWRYLHALPAAATSVLADRLLAMGAVIVGKTKSSQFGDGGEWVDEQAPWSPRGDGYQKPGRGAAGAGAGVAGYEWLKAAFAVDGDGGVRQPAAAHGVYSLRMSRGGVSLDGTQTSSPTFDSAGLMARDVLELYNTAMAVLTHGRSDVPPPPGRLVYPADVFDTVPSKERQKLMAHFVTAMENHLGVKAERIRLSSLWNQHGPDAAKDQSLGEYIGNASFRLYCYEFYHTYDAFRSDYTAKVGHAPYAEASVLHKWSIGKSVSKSEYDEYQTRLEVFRKWFGEQVMNITSAEQRWTAMLLPFDSEAPDYRDEKPREPPHQHGFSAELLSSALQTPQVVVPFAQLPYTSRISGRKEFHPVYGSVMGPRGGDLAVVYLVRRAFESVRWRTRVDTGRLSFPIGDNERNVDDRHVAVSGDDQLRRPAEEALSDEL